MKNKKNIILRFLQNPPGWGHPGSILCAFKGLFGAGLPSARIRAVLLQEPLLNMAVSTLEKGFSRFYNATRTAAIIGTGLIAANLAEGKINNTYNYETPHTAIVSSIDDYFSTSSDDGVTNVVELSSALDNQSGTNYSWLVTAENNTDTHGPPHNANISQVQLDDIHSTAPPAANGKAYWTSEVEALGNDLYKIIFSTSNPFQQIQPGNHGSAVFFEWRKSYVFLLNSFLKTEILLWVNDE